MKEANGKFNNWFAKGFGPISGYAVPMNGHWEGLRSKDFEEGILLKTQGRTWCNVHCCYKEEL